MTPLFPAQRAAEEFDQALRGSPTASVDERYARLLTTVELLRTQPALTPRADFVADLRERLMTAAETELVAGPAQVHQLAPRRATHRRLGTIAASLVIVGGTAGMAAAASGALPGEALYPVKRGIEQVRTAVHLDQAGKGGTQLDQASTRLEEVRRLQTGSADPALVEETLGSFRETAASGSDKLFVAYQGDGDAAHIEDVRLFTARHLGELSMLSKDAAPQTTDAFVDATDTMADIDQQARVLCSSCEPRSPVALPGALTAGAGALSANVLLTRPVGQAQADAALAQAQLDDSIAKLQTAAEKKAGTVPTVEQLAQAAADVRARRTASPDTPVSSTITPDGELLPAVPASTGTSVKVLVSGVTGTLTTATEHQPLTGTPLDDTVKDLTDDLGNTGSSLIP